MASRKQAPIAQEEARFSAGRPSRICIVTAELEGPFLNGGVGSTNRGLALASRQLGHQVDILYTQVGDGRPVCLRGDFAGHVAAYARDGIRLQALHNMAPGSDWAARSWVVLQHLLQERPDLVFFDDLFGTGYFPLLARRTGAPELADTAMVVTAHGALEWVGELDEVALLNFDGLPLFEMERRSLELADLVRAPSRHILNRYAAYGWKLPARSAVMPNFVSAPRTGVRDTAIKRVAINEIVFFGRLETRKGIWLFLRAIDRIKYRLAGATVTFLGKSRETATTILHHAKGWPFRIRLMTDFNQDQALAYLRGPGRLAVMPSPEDNSPSTVLECLEEQIPFLTTSGSGAEELLDPACHAANLIAPTVDALAEGILRAVETGGSTARQRHDPDQLLGTFSSFVDRILADRHRAPWSPAAKAAHALLAIAPFGQSAETTVSLLRQGLRDLGADTIIHLVTTTPDLLRAQLANMRVRLWSHTDLGAAAAALAADRPDVIALCDTGAIPDRKWFDRAAACFANGIGAVTGMGRVPGDSPLPPTEPWFSRAPAAPVHRHLIGNASAMLTLAQSTNDGFALIRSDVLDLVPRLQARDPHSGRLWPACVILHELMAALSATGGRFELIPDLPAQVVLRDPLAAMASEGQALRQAARWLTPPDPSLWAVTRLAQDAGIDRIRQAEGHAWREALSQKSGFDVPAQDVASPWAQQAELLARLAIGAGQVDLAVELVANLHPDADHVQPDCLPAFIRARATAIHLADRYRKGAFHPLNLMHDYSLTAISERELQLHANTGTEPRATLIFPDVDLTGLNAFTGTFSLPDSRARPVRLRVDLFADSGKAQFTFERLLKPGASEGVTVDLPDDLRLPCRVVLGVELADPMDTHEHAYIRLAKAGFVHLAGKNTP